MVNEGLEGPLDLLQLLRLFLPWSELDSNRKRQCIGLYRGHCLVLVQAAWSFALAGSQCTTYWSLLWPTLWQVVIKEACHLPYSLMLAKTTGSIFTNISIKRCFCH